MGRVYLARDRWLGRMVALKQAHDDALARQLAREVRVTAGLEHPGIITVYDEGRDEDGQLFYTMRLMRGRPLSQLLAEQPTGEREGKETNVRKQITQKPRREAIKIPQRGEGAHRELAIGVTKDKKCHKARCEKKQTSTRCHCAKPFAEWQWTDCE